MRTDKKKFKSITKALKCINEFKDVEIKESWFYDVWELEEEIKEKQKFLRVVKRERKLQPTLHVVTPITNEEQTLKGGYQISINAKGEIFYCKDW